MFNLDAWQFLALLKHPSINGGFSVKADALSDPVKLKELIRISSEWVAALSGDPDEIERIVDEGDLEAAKTMAKEAKRHIRPEHILSLIISMSEQVGKTIQRAVVPHAGKASRSGK